MEALPLVLSELSTQARSYSRSGVLPQAVFLPKLSRDMKTKQKIGGVQGKGCEGMSLGYTWRKGALVCGEFVVVELGWILPGQGHMTVCWTNTARGMRTGQAGQCS